MLKMLKINELKISAQSPIRLFILVKLIWASCALPAERLQLERHYVVSRIKGHGDWLVRVEVVLASWASLAAEVLTVLVVFALGQLFRRPFIGTVGAVPSLRSVIVIPVRK